MKIIESEDLSDSGLPTVDDGSVSSVRVKVEPNGDIIESAKFPLQIPNYFENYSSVNFEESIAGKPHNSAVVNKPKDSTIRLSPGFMKWQKLFVVEDLKATVCHVWSELDFSEEAASVYRKERYELPDGTTIYLGAERFKSPELLIHPGLDLPFLEKCGLEKYTKSIPSVIHDSLNNVHVDLRKELVKNLILVGGNSLLPGVFERLTKELSTMLPSVLKPRFLMPGKTEQLFSTFTGGSILASLGSFHQMWISRQEYEEYGADAVVQRCIH